MTSFPVSLSHRRKRRFVCLRLEDGGRCWLGRLGGGDGGGDREQVGRRGAELEPGEGLRHEQLAEDLEVRDDEIGLGKGDFRRVIGVRGLVGSGGLVDGLDRAELEALSVASEVLDVLRKDGGNTGSVETAEVRVFQSRLGAGFHAKDAGRRLLCWLGEREKRGGAQGGQEGVEITVEVTWKEGEARGVRLRPLQEGLQVDRRRQELTRGDGGARVAAGPRSGMHQELPCRTAG